MARIEENGTGTALHISGEFVASWTTINLTDTQKRVVGNMIDEAVKFGERKKSEELRKALNL